MDELELPNGDVVTPEDVFLYGNYPYRVKFPDETRDSATVAETPDDSADAGTDDPAFFLSPLYWGGGEMDIPFRNREALVDQWDDSPGLLDAEEWAAWLREARDDDRFDDAELDALARELPVSEDGGVVTRIRRALGL